MLSICRTLPQFLVTPSINTDGEKSLKQQNGSPIFKHFTKISLLSNTKNSCPKTSVSLSLVKTKNHQVIDYNVQILQACEMGNLKNAMNLFSQSETLGLELHTCCSILQLCAEVKSLNDGKKVHDYICSIGGEIDSLVCAKLVFMYVNCGDLVEGRRIFDTIANEKVFLWNLLISEYAKIGNYEESIHLYMRMRNLGVEANSYTLTRVLKCYAALGRVVEGERVHGYLLKIGFGCNNNVVNALIAFYFKCRRMKSAHKLFEGLTDRDVVTWNSMISGYVANGLAWKALMVYKEMLSEGISVDLTAMVNVLIAIGSLERLGLARAIHAYAIKARLCYEISFANGMLENGKEVHSNTKDLNMPFSLFASNALIDMYAKCGSIEDALTVFSEMPRKDIVSWNTIIGGYSKNRLPNEALSFFVRMQNDLKPDTVTVTCILPSCGSLAALDRGREIHSFIIKNGLSSDQFVMNALVDMYVKCGALVLAGSLFSIMPEKNLVSWTVMIAGYCMHGFGRRAMSTFSEMRCAGIKPDSTSFISILSACSHSGLLEKGWSYFNIMQNDCKIEPTLEHYACMVDLLSRAGKLSEAYSFIKDMPIEADCFIWGALLSGCRVHHDVKLAEKVAEHLFELEPENTRYYVLLANSYAEAERWEEVKKLRQKIGLRGLKKEPGCSWIEMEGKVHIFVAGDNAHPLASDIDLLLKKWQKNMKEEGYSLNMRYALINAEEMRKEEARCGHSEKLAMAFGVLSLPPGKIIRVTKNFRACSDCHEMAKYISKVIGREIILRDSHRFHHFKEGSCSCRGYW